MSKSLFVFGVCVTFIYFAGLTTLISLTWIEFSKLTPNEWGDFLAGSLGPLAIFWLILGFFQQGQELRHSVDALKLQAEELKNSVEQQKQLVGITERQLSLDVEVRAEQIKALLARDLPFFMLFPVGSSGGSYGMYLNFHAKNIGATASSFNINVVLNNIEIHTVNHGSLDSGSKVEFSVPLSKLGAPSILLSYFFDVEVFNIRGQSRKQQFRYDGHNLKLLSCDPEQV